MDLSKSKFLTVFLLFSGLCLCLANEESAIDPLAQSENLGQKPPFEKECCNYGHTTCCGGGDYSNPPYVQNPGNKWGGGPSFQPSPTCSWQGKAGDYCNPPCVPSPSNKWCSAPSFQPSPTCSWQGQAGDYCNPPWVQNPGSKCCSGPSCQPSPTCPWQGPCSSCGCVKSDVKVEGQLDSDHHYSIEPIPPKN